MPFDHGLRGPVLSGAVCVLALATIALSGCSADSQVQDAAGPTSAAAQDYLTSNCAVPAAPAPSTEPPADGQGLGEVTVTYDAQGVPQVTVGPQAGPVEQLQTLDLAPGDGTEVKEGDVITFNYCGVGMTTRQIFDSSWVRNEPLTYGLDELIPGWSAGLPGMKAGGQRLLIIPGDLGYGPEPNPASGILPDETLIFVVEVVSVGEAS